MTFCEYLKNENSEIRSSKYLEGEQYIKKHMHTQTHTHTFKGKLMRHLPPCIFHLLSVWVTTFKIAVTLFLPI